MPTFVINGGILLTSTIAKKMKEQKIFFAGNLKFLRERRKKSQEELAAILGIKRSKLAAMESGQTKSPPAEDFLNISDYFKMSIDSLLKVDLSVLSELSLRELEAGNDIYITGSKIRVLAVTVDKENEEYAEYVPIKAKAGYIAGYSDPEYIASLPKFNLPFLPKGKTFRMFPITGDSMLPFPLGSNIICYYVQDWRSLKPQTLCIAILKGEQDFVFKQVTVRPEGLLMESLNKQYTPYTVPASEVLELWQYHSYHTPEVPEAQDMQSIATIIREIQADIKVIKAKA
jgi:transcriptional regulator with XRE-family HTH domain